MASDDMDRDFAVRTMLGEARNQGDAGLAAVANVILNRASSGKYGGKTPTDVVLAPSQFEPWQTRKSELLAIKKTDPAYQRAAQIYDMVSSGEIPDITAGATHFLNRKVVVDRSGKLPRWAQGEGQDIGAHTFLKPNGAVKRGASAPAAGDLSGFDALDALAGGGEKPEAPVAPAATGGVRVSLPNAPANNGGGLDGFDALDKIATAGETAATKPEPGSSAAAVGAGIISGIPVVGPAVMDKVQRGLAHVRAYSSGKPYDQELENVRQFTQGTVAENPNAETFGKVLGGVVGLAPVASTGAGAAALGMRGNLLTRALAGGASGTAIGAADAAARGENVEHAAATGGGLGVIAPVAGRAIGMAAAPVVNRLTTAAQNTFGGASRANNALLAAVEASGQDIPALRAELARNPNLTLADLSPALREQVVGLAQGGPQAPTVQAWVNARREAAGGQVREAFDTAIGAAPDPVALREQLAQTAQTNARNAFQPILRNAQPVSLDGLSEGARGRIMQAQERALAPFSPDARAAFSDAERLHLTQQQLRREADTLGGSAAGSDRLAAGDVRNLRNEVVNRLDAATGGQFRTAQRQFADDLAVREAFDNGMSALNRVRSGAQGLDARPEALRREWQGMSQPEREAYREGVRTQIAATMDAARNPARAGEAITDADFNRQKLAIIFGDDEAGQIMRAVQDSRRMAETNNRVFGGSDTAQRTAARESVRVRGDSAPAAGLEIPALAGVVGGPGAAAASIAAKGGNRLLGAMGRRADNARNRMLADDLTAAGPQGEDVLNRLEQFLASRRGNPMRVREAIERNAPLNLLIRSAAPQSVAVP